MMTKMPKNMVFNGTGLSFLGGTISAASKLFGFSKLTTGFSSQTEPDIVESNKERHHDTTELFDEPRQKTPVKPRLSLSNFVNDEAPHVKNLKRKREEDKEEEAPIEETKKRIKAMEKEKEQKEPEGQPDASKDEEREGQEPEEKEEKKGAEEEEDKQEIKSQLDRYIEQIMAKKKFLAHIMKNELKLSLENAKTRHFYKDFIDGKDWIEIPVTIRGSYHDWNKIDIILNTMEPPIHPIDEQPFSKTDVYPALSLYHRARKMLKRR